ncbi:VanZ family protein [uncultured Clostridium sp.]|uniref:VanZ family protein n=1 Tax=uncultured Clostridium sp. TaxID=59620 RepID=UPI002615344A|nr:VanZ family protein [uncultured Clostridium sp.]
MLRISGNVGFFIVIICLVIYEVFRFVYKRKDRGLKEIIVNSLFKIYLALVASKVYFPMVIGFGENLKFNLPKIWLRPLWSIKQYIISGGMENCIYLVVGNILLLVPFGIFLGYYYNRNLKEITIMCLLISTFIEATQLIISLVIPNTMRFFEINDIILNTLGGVIGYVLYKGIVEGNWALRKRRA